MQNFLQPVTLSANQVRLEPLAPQHEAGLRQAVQDGELWKMLVTTAPAPEDVAGYIQAALATRTAFAVIDETTDEVVGTTAFYQPDAAIRRVYIGLHLVSPIGMAHAHQHHLQIPAADRTRLKRWLAAWCAGKRMC